MSATVLLDNLALPECPRWHDGRLWFSDVHDGTVWAMTEGGQAEPVLGVLEQPGGLGWLPDGRLLVLATAGAALLRLDGDELVTVCDLSPFAEHVWNDMTVTADGRAYVGNLGYDVARGDEPTGAPLVCVEPDGEAWVVAEQLLLPNGSCVVDDGDTTTLLVAETFGQRISAFDVAPDGSLRHPRVWADLRPNVPAGMCLDAQGAAWVADPVHRGVMRVVGGAGAVEWIPVEGRSVYACVLGGSDGRTLYMCTGTSTNPAKTLVARTGRIEALRVAVPAADHP
jgi:sugar lactone lactonase YvrE